MDGEEAPVIQLVRVERSPAIDLATREATRLFLRRLPEDLSAARAMLYGSRARGDHHAESDVDLAVILTGPPKDRWTVTREMARLAFDVLMETDVFIDPLAIWELELAHPERFSNPALVRAIVRDGIPIG